MPIHEILPCKRTCCKRIEDLKVKNHQEAGQYFIFPDETSFIDKEEQRQDRRHEKADDGQNGKKAQGHGNVICFSGKIRLYHL